MQQAGLPASQGFSSGTLMGYAVPPVTQDPSNQQRSSSETSFLREILEQTLDCTIYTNTLAKRILFDDSKNAKGVLVESQGSTFALSANKEVILSAGAVSLSQTDNINALSDNDSSGRRNCCWCLALAQQLCSRTWISRSSMSHPALARTCGYV